MSQVQRFVIEATSMKSWWVLLSTPKLSICLSAKLPLPMHSLCIHLVSIYGLCIMNLAGWSVLQETTLSEASHYPWSLPYYCSLPVWLLTKLLLGIVPLYKQQLNSSGGGENCVKDPKLCSVEMFHSISQSLSREHYKLFSLYWVQLDWMVAAAWSPSDTRCLFAPFGARQRGKEQCYSCLTVVFATPAAGKCSSFPTGKTCPRVLAI